jgi:ribonuclease HI
MNTIIFTDGSSRGNPGKGGWGAIIAEGENLTEIGGREEETTNNRMEMKAVIEAFKKVSGEGKITVHIDSSYVVKGIREWIHGWEQNGWMTKAKEPVLNSDLWKELKAETVGRSIFWNIIPGHAGISGNERCDVIATSHADSKPTSLYIGNVEGYQVNLEIPKVLPQKTSKKKSKSGVPAYSYVSKVDGKIETHKWWKDCEQRVKGAKGAKFQKVYSKTEEDDLIASW